MSDLRKNVFARSLQMEIDSFSEEKGREATRTGKGKRKKEYGKVLALKDVPQTDFTDLRH